MSAHNKFDTYLRELIYHPERSKKWMKDKLLGLLEKKILQGHLLIRDNKGALVIEDMKKIPDTNVEFMDAHKNLLLGIAYNNIGNYPESEKYLLRAVHVFRMCNIHYHLFTSLFNLLNVLSNVGRFKEMEDVLQEMEELNPPEKLAQVRLLRARFIYACDTDDSDRARELLEVIRSIRSDISEYDFAAHLICEFMFFIKVEEFDDAQKTLEELKKCRKFMASENYHFMKRLLSHLISDDTIYVYEREFPALSMLFHQMKVIELLQANDVVQAEVHWKELQKLFPEQYQNGFIYQGDKNLFSLCLDKQLKFSGRVISKKTIEGPKYHAAFDILKGSSKPIRSKELYKILYGEDVQSKHDLSKLAILISKIRRNHQVKILSRKGSYQLVQETRVN